MMDQKCDQNGRDDEWGPDKPLDNEQGDHHYLEEVQGDEHVAEQLQTDSEAVQCKYSRSAQNGTVDSVMDDLAVHSYF